MKKIYRVEIYTESYDLSHNDYFPLSDFFAKKEDAEKAVAEINSLTFDELNDILILVGGYVSEDVYDETNAEIISYDLNE